MQKHFVNSLFLGGMQIIMKAKALFDPDLWTCGLDVIGKNRINHASVDNSTFWRNEKLEKQIE